MNATRMTLLAGAMAGAMILGPGATSANAGGFVSVDFGWSGGGWYVPAYSYCPPPVVYAPAPVYYGGYYGSCYAPYSYGYGARYYGGYSRRVCVSSGWGDYRWHGSHHGSRHHGGHHHHHR